MSWEIELKLRVAVHDDVRQRLRDVGGVLQRSVLEVNDIFDRPDGGLSGRGVGLRIRSVHPVGEPATDSEAGPTILTVKGPRLPGILKSREEIEFDVPNAETGTRMLDLLGFVRVLRYEKRRESWGISDCCVELDEAPHIGRFVEIEGPGETSISAVRGELGLADAEAVADSYVRLMMIYCEAQGLRDRVVAFE